MAPFLFVLVDRGSHQCTLETRLSQLVVPLVEVLLRKDLLRALLGSLSAAPRIPPRHLALIVYGVDYQGI